MATWKRAHNVFVILFQKDKWKGEIKMVIKKQMSSSNVTLNLDLRSKKTTFSLRERYSICKFTVQLLLCDTFDILYL